MAYNFGEGEIREMYSCYQQALETIQSSVNNVVNSLTAKAQELRYEPLVNVSRDAVDYYNDTLKHDELRALSDWQESDMSFTYIMEEQRAGDAAKARSRQLEGDIEDQIQSMPAADASALSGIDTSNWRCDVSDFEEIRETISRFADQLEDSRSQYASRVAAGKDENTIYVSIEPVIMQTFSIVANGFRNSISSSYDVLSEAFQEHERLAQNRAASAVQDAAARAQSIVSEGANDLKNKVKQIWD